MPRSDSTTDPPSTDRLPRRRAHDGARRRADFALFSKDKLTFAAVNGREHVIDYTLADLEQRLDARRFVRIHRATIVNASLVQELHPGIDGGVLVRLKDEKTTELTVARDRVRALKERLGI